MERNRYGHPPRPRHVAEDVLHWRSEVLRHAGCDAVLAWDLAADGDIDLHDLLNLIDRGCPPTLAARILAPLDGDPRPC